MQLKVNRLQLICTLLTILCYFAIPLIYFGIPGLRIPLLRVTAFQLFTLISDWLLLPLLFSILMLIGSLFSSHTMTLVAGGVSAVGNIALGFSLSAILANSNLTNLLNFAASKISQSTVNLSPVVNAISTASMNLYFGFYLNLLFSGLFILFGLIAPVGGNGFVSQNRRRAGNDGDSQFKRRSTMYK